MWGYLEYFLIKKREYLIMEILINIIEFFFASALFINALLFVPQAIKIWKAKSSKGNSITTFLGFNVIQLLIVLHGIIMRDYILALGYAISLVTCGVVTILIFHYREKK